MRWWQCLVMMSQLVVVAVDGGLGIVAADEVGIPTLLPLVTQQFTEGQYVGPHPLQTKQQLQFAPEAFCHPATAAGSSPVNCAAT
jgi:hypothetical protein